MMRWHIVLMPVLVFLLVAVPWAAAVIRDIVLDAGTFPGGDELRQVQFSGTLAGEGNLFGAVFTYVNDSPTGWATHGEDTAKVRPIIGTATTLGPGTVRFLHGHAIGGPRATGVVNALNGQVTCNQGNPWCWNIEVAATGPGATKGIRFATSGPGNFSYLLDSSAAVVHNGFALLTTDSPGGRLVWSGGGSIDSPRAGVIRVDGILQNPTIAALEARIAVLEAKLAPPAVARW